MANLNPQMGYSNPRFAILAAGMDLGWGWNGSGGWHSNPRFAILIYGMGYSASLGVRI
jgi:hypothetical protein